MSDAIRDFNGRRVTGMQPTRLDVTSPDGQVGKVSLPVAPVAKKIGEVIQVTKEWCVSAAQAEADVGDPDVTVGKTRTLSRSVRRGMAYTLNGMGIGMALAFQHWIIVIACALFAAYWLSEEETK